MDFFLTTEVLWELVEYITQPDLTCFECKQVQSTRRAVTRNTSSFEGQAAPTPKAVVISCSSLSWFVPLCPAQHKGKGNWSRPAPGEDRLPKPCYLSSNLTPQ